MICIALLNSAAFRSEQQSALDVLRHETVQEWISIYGNRDNTGPDCIGGCRKSTNLNGYIEIFREKWRGHVCLRAEVVFDPRSGPAASAAWEAQKLDPKLEKMFGEYARVRIEV